MTSAIHKTKAALTGPMTQGELARAAGIPQGSVCRHLKTLMAEPKEAHIGDWRRPVAGMGPPVAVYYPGPGDDVECPFKPLSDAEKARRAYYKKAPEARNRYRRKGVHSITSQKAPEPCWLTQMFFGLGA
jgi:hypothetical protein